MVYGTAFPPLFRSFQGLVCLFSFLPSSSRAGCRIEEGSWKRFYPFSPLFSRRPCLFLPFFRSVLSLDEEDENDGNPRATAFIFPSLSFLSPSNPSLLSSFLFSPLLLICTREREVRIDRDLSQAVFPSFPLLLPPGWFDLFSFFCLHLPKKSLATPLFSSLEGPAPLFLFPGPSQIASGKTMAAWLRLFFPTGLPLLSFLFFFLSEVVFLQLKEGGIGRSSPPFFFFPPEDYSIYFTFFFFPSFFAEE